VTFVGERVKDLQLQAFALHSGAKNSHVVPRHQLLRHWRPSETAPDGLLTAWRGQPAGIERWGGSVLDRHFPASGAVEPLAHYGRHASRWAAFRGGC
jgi:hypothetical protein